MSYAEEICIQNKCSGVETVGWQVNRSIITLLALHVRLKTINSRLDAFTYSLFNVKEDSLSAVSI